MPIKKPFREAEVVDLIARMTPREHELLEEVVLIAQQTRVADTMQRVVDYAISLQKHLNRLGHDIPPAEGLFIETLDMILSLQRGATNG